MNLFNIKWLILYEARWLKGFVFNVKISSVTLFKIWYISHLMIMSNFLFNFKAQFDSVHGQILPTQMPTQNLISTPLAESFQNQTLKTFVDKKLKCGT